MKSIRAGKVVMLLVVFVILISSFGCSKKDDFNIVGTWRGVITIEGNPMNVTVVFSGSESGGTVRNESGVSIGSYSVFNSDVDWGFQVYLNPQYGNAVYSFTGTGDDNKMNGTAIYYVTNFPNDRFNGTWNLTRQ